MLLSYKPSILYKSKMIPLDQIGGEERATNSRLCGSSLSKIKALESAIEAVGLNVPISVEINQHDPEFPDDATYTLRDGNHRLSAYRNLAAKHGAKYCNIKAVVYERSTSPNAEVDWLVWQVTQNRHEDKVCTPNSMEDLANMLVTLLLNNQIGDSAATDSCILDNDWDSPVVENAVDAYMSESETFKGMTFSQKQEIKDKMWSLKGKIYKLKVKRYNPKTEIKEIVQRNLNCLGLNQKSQDGKSFVRVVSNDDLHAAIPRLFVDKLNQKHGEGVENVLVFHCKIKDVNKIDESRKKALKSVREINKLFSKYITTNKDFKGQKVVNKVYFVGQKLAQGEEEGKLIKQVKI